MLKFDINMKKIFSILGYVASIFLFLYIRLPALLIHSVAYTYDQGRDFMAGANIILTHHIPFIGPTTGISGLFHGSWWYYYLTLPFLLFKGAPIGYYYANLAIHLLCLVAIVLFIKIKTNDLLAIFAGFLIAFSPYFTFTSLFVGNNIMVLPSLLLFLITNYLIFEKGKKKNNLLYFFNGLALGFVAEFELSFGLFIIPVYFLAHALFPQLRAVVKNKKSFLFTLAGLIIAFSPRILFELKNKFQQTRVLLSFFTKPKLYNPKSFVDVLTDRFQLFIGYWKGIFPNDFWAIFFAVLVLLAVMFLIYRKKKFSPFTLFSGYLVLFLFLISLVYKDNFWGNYYEGIQYVMMFFMISVFSQLNAKTTVIKVGFICIISVFFITQLSTIVLVHKASPQKDGLAIQEDAMNVIMQNESANSQFCVRIYTPPVIPHTYNYLFMYNRLKGKISTPSSEWVSGTCWFIVESDSYKKRRDDWLEVNEPKDKYEVSITKLKDVEVRYYKVLPK